MHEFKRFMAVIQLFKKARHDLNFCNVPLCHVIVMAQAKEFRTLWSFNIIISLHDTKGWVTVIKTSSDQYILYICQRGPLRHEDIMMCCVHKHVSKSIGIIGLHYVVPWGWGSLCSECSQSKNPRLEQSMMNLSHNWCSSCSAKRKTKHQEPQLDSNSEAAA